ncbi:DUF3087 family protein [Denitrificimonas sp. JX-1]|uniref:DUF3087 family protein n=1 Tax=Denitrificimonas halotolerans TaxID=3098930 RepID=A0ABU5GUC0_9GAMM|nr:DUF3087 family protein [Denitrificimonas sp. JX-1]MDY7220469.1 DUF3087 family protein [Denitrificimonas sp. JX-1]
MRKSLSSNKTTEPFKLAEIDPEVYRQKTRKASWIIITVFVSLAMLYSSLLVMFFGEPGGDNVRYNITGVLAGVAVTAILVRTLFSKQAWMAESLYSWQLKRSLMSVTNVMHHVKAGVAEQNPDAMKLLRFYHLGLSQMHKIDGNTGETSELAYEVSAHKAKMEELGLPTDQPTLNPVWLETVKTFKAPKK